MVTFRTVGRHETSGPPSNDADHAYGQGWVATRTSAGYTLDWMTGDLNGSEGHAEITAAEFARLRTDPEAFTSIVLAHDR
ncbi:MAG: hypothetical protein L0G99_00830 [Propionibacteriales bacterium]|nr:hypothetical protein [Propionibacteriales bacterium]